MPIGVAGVLIFNVLVTRLSDSVNNLRILDNGYSYLIDALNSEFIVLHPFASNGCKRVACAESFATEEYNHFKANVLDPIQVLANNPDASAVVSSSYYKNGELWRCEYSLVVTDTATFALIVTVPQSDIDQSSDDIQSSLNRTVVGMMVAFALCMAFLIVLFVVFVRILVREIVAPIIELKGLCVQVTNDDLSGIVPDTSSSSDMKVSILQLISAL